MPPQAALGILKGSLLGLGAAHGVGVVHRDYTFCGDKAPPGFCGA